MTDTPTYTRDWRMLRERGYQKWLREEGVPVHSGFAVEDLHTADLAPWPRFGQRGAVISLGDQELSDGWLIEIAPGSKTEPAHHLCEATVYVVEGRGATAIWPVGAEQKQTVEWQAGCMFSIPLNCWYQHFNLEGGQPCRVFVATSAPLMMNTLRNSDYIFKSDGVFPERYGGGREYFTDPGQHLAEGLWQTNFISDLRTFPVDGTSRGPGAGNMFFLMAGNAMSCHISQFMNGTYKKAHRHGPGAEIIILNGVGYSLFWYANGGQTKVDWKEGTVISPRDQEWHQHFNTGPTPARFVAFTFNHMVVQSVVAHITHRQSATDQEGADGIEYEDEDPEIFALFERECTAHGGAVTMPRPAHAAR